MAIAHPARPRISWGRLLAGIAVIALIVFAIYLFTSGNLRFGGDNEPAATNVEPAPALGPGDLQQAGCDDVEEIESQSFRVNLNQDVGDPFYWVVVTAFDGMDQDSWFMAVVEPGNSLDFENPLIAGKYWQLEGSQDDVVCFAQTLADESDNDPYLLYVAANNDSAPDNWETDFPEGWEMSTWAFDEAPVGTTAVFREVQFSLGDTAFGDSDEWGYFQLWDPSHPRNAQGRNVAYHFVVWDGYEMTTPSTMQGTGWYATRPEINRWDQAVREVESRDDAVVETYFCGPAADQPDDWEDTLPTGWSCAQID